MTGATLGGAGVLVTRAAEQAEPLCRAVRDAGGEPWLLPALTIAPLEYTSEPDRAEDLVLFVSRNAVRFGSQILDRPRAGLAAIGPSTAAALTEAGHRPDIVPATGYDSESLLAMPELADMDGRRVLIVRGRGGRELIAETLRARGAEVRYAEVYERRRPDPPRREIEAVHAAWRDGRLRFVTCLSLETLRNLVAILGDYGPSVLRGTTLVSASERVLQQARREDIAVDTLLSRGPEPADLVRAMILSPEGSRQASRT